MDSEQKEFLEEKANQIRRLAIFPDMVMNDLKYAHVIGAIKKILNNS